MSKTFLNLLAVACVFLGAQSLADQTNSVSSLSSTDAVNAYLQIQAQLHQTQMIEESNREQVIASLQQNASALDSRLQLLEQKMAEQRASEADSARRVEQTMLMVAGIGMLALAAVVGMVFLQLRTATRLIELAMAPAPVSNGARALPVVETAAAALPASARAALEFSNARLLGVIDRLEKRILELEETVRIPLNGNGSHSSEPERDTPSDRRVEDLIVEGQLYLDTNKMDKAVQCFDTALDIQPDNPDALIKKAAALEKLGQIEKAITCYDRAIDLGDSGTTALLQKGGMLNRLARYDEALQCYERALQTQEKKAVSS
jgi:tetratricopeptide (TPR) repeat protein